ncbi:MAG: hypothetical protein COA63_000975 [Methylophaga sp.]|nr:hypothetical protein [Methylophaga sp.]
MFNFYKNAIIYAGSHGLATNAIKCAAMSSMIDYDYWALVEIYKTRGLKDGIKKHSA